MVDNKCQQKLRIVIKPYLKVFYGDLAVGGYFGRSREYDACGHDDVVGGPDPVGHLAAHAQPNLGSSVNYGLSVHDAIIGFNSANGRSSSPTPPKGLTLGNAADSSIYNQAVYPNHDQWGGQFGRPRCIANYWRGAAAVDDNPHVGSSVDLKDLNNNEVRYYDERRLYINDGGASQTDNLKATIYTDGDVYIKNNIVNGEDAAGDDVRWNSPADIGVIVIVAKGNMYIDPSVTRLDAILIAYPKEVAGVAEEGEIWTCYASNGFNSDLAHFYACRQKLVVNGALIAQKVRLGRIVGSVREDNPSHNTEDTLAGEVVNLLPEYWLATPELPFFAGQLQKSDSFTYDPVNF